MQKKYILGQFRYCSQWPRLVSQLQSIPPWSLVSIGTQPSVDQLSQARFTTIVHINYIRTRVCERISYEESKKCFHLQIAPIDPDGILVFCQKRDILYQKFENFDLNFKAIINSGKNGCLKDPNFNGFNSLQNDWTKKNSILAWELSCHSVKISFFMPITYC